MLRFESAKPFQTFCISVTVHGKHSVRCLWQDSWRSVRKTHKKEHKPLEIISKRIQTTCCHALDEVVPQEPYRQPRQSLCVFSVSPNRRAVLNSDGCENFLAPNYLCSLRANIKTHLGAPPASAGLVLVPVPKSCLRSEALRVMV